MTKLSNQIIMVRNGEWDSFCEKYVWLDSEEMSENEKQLYNREYDTRLTPINYFQAPHPKSDQKWAYFFKFEGELIVGVCIISETTDWENSICLANIAVDKLHRRRGYAKELLDCMFNYLVNVYQDRKLLTIYHPYTEDILRPVVENMANEYDVEIDNVSMFPLFF